MQPRGRLDAIDLEVGLVGVLTDLPGVEAGAEEAGVLAGPDRGVLPSGRWAR